MSKAPTAEPRPLWRSLSASAVGIEMAVCVLLGWAAGYWADGELGSEPWLMLLGLIIGVVAGFRGLLRTSRMAWQPGAPATTSPDEDVS